MSLYLKYIYNNDIVRRNITGNLIVVNLNTTQYPTEFEYFIYFSIAENNIIINYLYLIFYFNE